MDRVALVLVEILESVTSSLENTSKETLLVYHVANPHAISWSNIVPWVVGNMRLRARSFWVWVEKRGSCHEPLEDVDKNPAIKLIDFYRAADRTRAPRRMMTWKAAHASKTLREIGPVNEQWMHEWLDQWRLA